MNTSPTSVSLGDERAGHFNDNGIYTKPQVAAIFGVTVRTLESWMHRRLVSYRKIGGTIRITGADIKELLDNHHHGKVG